MKKIFVIISLVVVATATSCKKDRVCACTYTSTSPATPGFSSTSTSEETYKKVSKGTAKRACVKKETTNSGSTVTSTSDCKLK